MSELLHGKSITEMSDGHNVLQPKGSSKEKGKGKKQQEEEERVKRAAKASSPILDREVVQVQAGTKPTQSGGSASPPIEEIEVNPSAIVARGVSVPSNGFSRSACLVWIVNSRFGTELQA